MGKDKKSKKSKRHKADKSKKRHQRSPSESSDTSADEHDQKRHELAQRITKHLEKRQAIGDDTGAKPFVWGKKIERELQQGKSIRDYSVRAEQERQQQRVAEIEKVRLMRETREAEKVRQEEELSMIARERAVAEAVELEAKEEEFYLHQLVDVAALRLAESRARPVDHIASRLHLIGHPGVSVDFKEPWTYFEGMLLEDVQDLHDGIKSYAELDKYNPLHVKFWKALLEIADLELGEALRRDEQDREHLRGAAAAATGSGSGPGGVSRSTERGVHPALERDIEGMLAGQTVDELSTLEERVGEMLRHGEGDPEYWEEVGRRLKIHKAKATVRTVQSEVLRQHLEASMAGVNVPLAMGWNKEKGSWSLLGAGVGRAASVEPDGDEDQEAALAREASLKEGKEEAAASSEEEEEEEEEEPDGRYSPPPVDPASIGGADVIPEEEDILQLDLLRKQVGMTEARRFVVAEAAAKSKRMAAAAEADRAYRELLADGSARPLAVHPMLRNIADAAPGHGEDGGFRSGRAPAVDEDDTTRSLRASAAKAMGADEADAPFGGEVPLEAKVYWWHDKYRPRKPKYFNRVHTGYEWNKYNQTHYDHDNPPPKVVQGYKFNIFYPELIDKNATPSFRLSRDPSNPEEMEIITFSAGPPYEDIAFRIVRKDWEYSHKRGYKCTFERGILHLYFNFKRARYRR